MPDGRKRCHAAPPDDRCSRSISVYLDPDDYRMLYDLTMARDTSMAETVRQIIREAAAE